MLGGETAIMPNTLLNPWLHLWCWRISKTTHMYKHDCCIDCALSSGCVTFH